MTYHTILTLFILILTSLFCPAMSQENDSLQEIESIERLYKRDVINQIKSELLEKAVSSDKPLDQRQKERIEIIASNAFSSLSKQLFLLKKNITHACRKQKKGKQATPDALDITFTLIQVDTVITASCDHIKPPNSAFEKLVRKVFNTFSFAPLPIQSQEIKLHVQVRLAD